MNLGTALKHLFPLADPIRDYTVADNAIVEWNLNVERPTEQQLQDAHIEVRKSEKISDLKEACELFILSGYVIPETGHAYGFQIYDQMNMTQQYILFLTDTTLVGVDWKTENNGTVYHSKPDFDLVINRAAKHKWDNIKRYWALKDQVKACTTQEEIEAITW